jgi:peptide/nickel transport system ATP-binding protein
MSETVLRVKDLVTAFATDRGIVRPVNGVSFEVKKGRTLAIVGESGSGKSVTSLSVMRLIPENNGRIEKGSILFEGQELVGASKKEMQKLRGNRMAMIFQEPMTALNPVFTVGEQIAEVLRLHEGLSRSAAHEKAIAMLDKVHIPDPKARAACYPHELSGGMRQRVMIAMSLSCNPKLLIADEPTTALDVTIQAQVLRLMRNLQEELGTAIVFITHDLGVVAEVADDVMVMYCGKIVEQGTVFEVFENPKHPYTIGLMKSLPKLTDHKETPLEAIRGMVPSLYDLPEGCRFSTRCDHVEAICDTFPPLVQIGDTHAAACHLHEKVGLS